MIASFSASPQCSGGTSHITSNSKPSGSWGVQALVRPVIACADEGACRLQPLTHLGQLLERGDLPCDVVHAHGAPAGLARGGTFTDGEEGDVVVVLRRRSAHEDEGALRVLDHGREPQDVAIKTFGASCVA